MSNTSSESGQLHEEFAYSAADPIVQQNMDRVLQAVRAHIGAAAFAELLANQIDIEISRNQSCEEKIQRIQDAMDTGQPTLVYQPIYSVADMNMVGLECLSRFREQPARPPDQWFKEASDVGLGIDLELNAITKAVTVLGKVKGDFFVSINLSPQTIVSGRLPEVLNGFPADRIVLEITEYAYVMDYSVLIEHLTPLRAKGMRLAIDDVGAGYASMRHILSLQPDIIKLDISLTRDIHRDEQKLALSAALVTFAHQTDCYVVAEGIENAEEMQTLKILGVDAAQGYHLSRPQLIEGFLELYSLNSQSGTRRPIMAKSKSKKKSSNPALKTAKKKISPRRSLK